MTEDKKQYKVQVGMEITGEITVKAENEEHARIAAKRHIKREPFNGTKIQRCFTNNVREW